MIRFILLWHLWETKAPRPGHWSSLFDQNRLTSDPQILKFRNGLLKFQIRGVKNFLKPQQLHLSIWNVYLTIYSSQIQDEPRFATESFSVASHGSKWTNFRAVLRHGKCNHVKSRADIYQKNNNRFDLEVGKFLEDFNKQTWRQSKVWGNFHPSMQLDLRSPASELKFQHYTSSESGPILHQQVYFSNSKQYLMISPQLNQFKPGIATSSVSVAMPGSFWVDYADPGFNSCKLINDPSNVGLRHVAPLLLSTLQLSEPRLGP